MSLLADNRIKAISIFLISFTFMAIFSSSYNWNHLSLDEGTYLAIGMMISKGKILYRDVFESKPPIFHFITSIMFTLVQNRIHAARFIVVGVAAFTSLIIYYIVLSKYDENSAVFAAFSFTFAASLPIFNGVCVLTEPFSTFFSVSALYILMTKCENSKSFWPVVLGILLSIQTLIRPTGVFFSIILLGLYVYLNKDGEWKTLLVRVFLGGLLVGFVVSAYFIYHQAFRTMLFWITEPIQGFQTYVELSILRKLEWGSDVFMSTLPLCGLGFISLRRNSSFLEKFNIMWLGFMSLFFVSSIFAGFTHYYYELLPSLVIQASIGYTSLKKTYSESNDELRKIIIIALVLSVAVTAAQIVPDFFEYRNKNDYSAILPVANSIRENSWPDDDVFIFETAWPKIGPSLYFLSERVPSIPNLFFFPWHMTENETSRVVDVTQSVDTKIVVVIGPSVSTDITDLLDPILASEYDLVKEYEDTSGLYPHIGESQVFIRLYKRRE